MAPAFRAEGSRGELRQIFLDVGVLGAEEIDEGAGEGDAAFLKDDEGGVGIDAVVFDALHAVFFQVEAMRGQGEGVLQAMGDQQGGALIDVALLHDQLNNSGGGDGVEAAGGRVIEEKLGLGDDGAGDGDAAAHATGKLVRKFFDGVFELDKSQTLEDTAIDVFLIIPLFEHAIGDIVADGERVEQGTLLEDHADVAAQIEERFLGEIVDIKAEELDPSRIGLDEAIGELEQDAFSASGRAEDDDHLSGAGLEADVDQNRMAVEADGDMFKRDDGRIGVADGLVRRWDGFGGRHRFVSASLF